MTQMGCKHTTNCNTLIHADALRIAAQTLTIQKFTVVTWSQNFIKYLDENTNFPIARTHN